MEQMDKDTFARLVESLQRQLNLFTVKNKLTVYNLHTLLKYVTFNYEQNMRLIDNNAEIFIQGTNDWIANESYLRNNSH